MNVAYNKILIADDDPTTLMILEATLTRWGYEVVVAHDGDEAWAALGLADSPRMMILDWMMPGMDGLALCKRIRASRDPGGRYVILLSAKNEKDDLVEALEAGADDFLTKPWDLRELQSRIHVGQRMLACQDELSKKAERLAEYAANMEMLAEDRAKQLVHADRMTTLGLLAAGMAHEINNPSTYILGNQGILKDFWCCIVSVLDGVLSSGSGKGDKVYGIERKQVEHVIAEFPNTLDGIETGVCRISKIVSDLKRFARKGDVTCRDCQAREIIDNALALCAGPLKHNATVQVNVQENLPDLFVDSQQIEQVIINLLTNASSAVADGGKVNIHISALDSGGWLLLKVEDDGPGFSEQALKNMWTPFFTTKPPGEGTGLGLSISQGIVENHGGTIDASNRPEGGAAITIRLPFKNASDSGTKL